MLKKNKTSFDNILFPYKGTTNEEKSFKKTMELASATGAKTTILTCLEERHTFGFFKTNTSRQEFEREYKLVKKEHARMKKYAEDYYNVSCRSKIIKNSRASVKILEFAKKHNMDLIAMTKTKFSSHYEKIHHHSTIENVYRNASCATMILN